MTYSSNYLLDSKNNVSLLNKEKLMFYGLYMFSTEGDKIGTEPSIKDYEEKLKYDAWEA